MPGIGIGIGLNRLRLVGGSIDSPTNLTASFDIPSISGQVSWVDNSGGTAQYEIYSSDKNKPNGTLTLICDGSFRNGTLNVTVPFTDANGKAYTHVYPIIVQANVKVLMEQMP